MGVVNVGKGKGIKMAELTLKPYTPKKAWGVQLDGEVYPEFFKTKAEAEKTHQRIWFV